MVVRVVLAVVIAVMLFGVARLASADDCVYGREASTICVAYEIRVLGGEPFLRDGSRDGGPVTFDYWTEGMIHNNSRHVVEIYETADRFGNFKEEPVFTLGPWGGRLYGFLGQYSEPAVRKLGCRIKEDELVGLSAQPVRVTVRARSICK